MPQRRKTSASEAYVFEFTRLINPYLEHHAEIVADQHRGRAVDSNKRVDLSAQAEAAQDSAPVDAYH